MRGPLLRTAPALVLACSILVLYRTAPATFIGLQVIDITNNNDDLSEYAIYALFDSPTDHVVAVGDSTIASTTGFFHNTIAGEMASALPYTSEQLAISDNPDADSFVTIDYDTGDNNNTLLDPNFDENAFINGDNIGVNAGWFDNLGILSGQGIVGEDGLLLLAVLTPLNDKTGQHGLVTGTLTIFYEGDGTPGAESGTASFVIPAPSALALLGLAALRGPRRRRNDM